MPEKRINAMDDDALAARIVSLLNDEQVLAKMREVLFPHALIETGCTLGKSGITKRLAS